MFRIHESELSTFSNSSEIYIDSKGTKVKYKLHYGQSMGSLFRATTRLESQDYTDVYNRLHGYWRSMRSQTALKIWSKRKTPVEPRSAKQQTENSGPNQLNKINSFMSWPSKSLTPDPLLKISLVFS